MHGLRLFLFSAAVLLAAAWLVRYVGIKRLGYRRYFTPNAAFEGESVTFVEEIHNRFFLPLLFVDVEAFMFNELRIAEYSGTEHYLQHFISRFFLAPFTRVKRSIPIECLKRGYYELDSVTVHFFRLRMLFESKAEVSVYPRALPYEAGNPLEYFLSHNAVTAEHKLLPDPFSYSGVRDYRPGDPFGSINYKATARTGALKVNRRDFLTSRNFMVYLDFHMASANQPMPSDEYAACMERALSYTADFMAKAIRQGFSAGFAANCKLVSGAGYVRFPMGRGEGHYMEILKAMAHVRIMAGHSFKWLLRQDVDALWNAEIYIMTVIKSSPDLDEMEAVFKGLGNRVTVVVLDGESIKEGS